VYINTESCACLVAAKISKIPKVALQSSIWVESKKCERVTDPFTVSKARPPFDTHVVTDGRNLKALQLRTRDERKVLEGAASGERRAQSNE
jgi:hypothetical protein